MTLQIYWGDRLEKLADAMFLSATDRLDPFETECTVVGSPVMAGWLKQYFLYDFPNEKKRQHVLACWNFQLLHPFVNDWIAKAGTGTPVGQRNPTLHPYASDVLQWRIWNELCRESSASGYSSLHAYIGDDPKARDRKRWGLARHLAKLLDDYQNYRPDLLEEWAKGRLKGLEAQPDLAWQTVLWQHLVAEEPGTYLKLFLNMKLTLPACGIKDTYRRITVFHISAMPKAYLQFFVELGKFMPVEMFLFNPSEEFWIEDSTTKQHIKELIKNCDELAWMDPPHPVLSGFGRGTQAFLGTTLDVQEAIIHDQIHSANTSDTLLQSVQKDIRMRGNDENRGPVLDRADDDGSIQFHSCHGPMREVEVTRDLILKWFADHKGSQPRDVQVLVPDMETYAPFIESVFQVTDHSPPIPCSISKRPAVSAGAVGAAFVRLMQFNESRMTAPEAIEILELEPVRQRYHLEPDEVSEIRTLVNTAGIRWGRDAQHINQALSATTNKEQRTKNKEQDAKDLPDTVTWRRGLDRLIAGFSIGRCTEGEDMIEAGELGSLHVCDGVEGSTAERVGKLAQFFEDLCLTADQIASPGVRRVSDWTECYTAMLERFFRGTESSFKEITEIKRGITAVADAAKGAGDPAVPPEIAAAAIETQLGGMAPAGRADINAVLFSPMHTMQVTPRKMIILLGLNEGVFPRADQRPAFDLLSIKPRYGDRSLRYEDRLAFLEAIMSARERLLITYTGRNISNNKEVPPSPAVTEFLQYLNGFSKDKDIPLAKPLEHKLHGFNPAYYNDKDHRLFSYSRSNHAAASVLAGLSETKPGASAKATCGVDYRKDQRPPQDIGPVDCKPIALEALQAFFDNPAKHFYANVLKIRLIDPTRDDVRDSEMFDGDTLDDYALNKIMIKDILTKSRSAGNADYEPDEDYFKRLQEQAFIPLGALGLGRTRQQLVSLKAFLNSQGLPDRHSNLYQSLLVLEEARDRPTSILVNCGNYEISAGLPILGSSGESPEPHLLLSFRYSSIKPKDRLRAWLAHLAGHAAGEESFETVIAGKDKTKLDVSIIPPINKHIALNILAPILALYERGCTELIPFSPVTSYAYAQQIAKDGNAVKAAEKAEDAWDGYYFPECNDRNLFAAWKEEGPMPHPEFIANAHTVWKDFPFPSGKKAETAGVPAPAEENDE